MLSLCVEWCWKVHTKWQRGIIGSLIFAWWIRKELSMSDKNIYNTHALQYDEWMNEVTWPTFSLYFIWFDSGKHTKSELWGCWIELRFRCAIEWIQRGVTNSILLERLHILFYFGLNMNAMVLNFNPKYMWILLVYTHNRDLLCEFVWVFRAIYIF